MEKGLRRKNLHTQTDRETDRTRERETDKPTDKHHTFFTLTVQRCGTSRMVYVNVMCIRSQQQEKNNCDETKKRTIKVLQKKIKTASQL